MVNIDIVSAKKNFFKLVSDVNIGYNPINIVGNNGMCAVLVSEEEWKKIEKELSLNSKYKFDKTIDTINNDKN